MPRLTADLATGAIRVLYANMLTTFDFLHSTECEPANKSGDLSNVARGGTMFSLCKEKRSLDQRRDPLFPRSEFFFFLPPRERKKNLTPKRKKRPKRATSETALSPRTTARKGKMADLSGFPTRRNIARQRSRIARIARIPPPAPPLARHFGVFPRRALFFGEKRGKKAETASIYLSTASTRQQQQTDRHGQNREDARTRRTEENERGKACDLSQWESVRPEGHRGRSAVSGRTRVSTEALQNLVFSPIFPDFPRSRKRAAR